MIYNVNELRKDTVALIKDIDKQITEVKREAERMGVEPESLRDIGGGWVMTSLLHSKAVAYNSLILLQSQGR